MPTPNTFNNAGTYSGDVPIVTGVAGRSIRVRQLNFQNRHASNSTDITIKSGSDVTIFGPVTIAAGQLLTMELASEEHQHLLILEDGDSLVVNSSVSVPATCFGFAGIA